MKVGDEIIYTQVLFSTEPVVKYVHNGVIEEVFENVERYYIKFKHRYTEQIMYYNVSKNDIQLNISKIREDKLKILGIE